MKLHDEIRREMLRRINDGEWAVGDDIPHEIELTEEFGASRGTVRRALSALVEQGLVERRKRAGSRVVQQTSHASKLNIALVREEIEGRGFAYSYRLLERDVTEEASGRHLRIACLHLADGAPFQLEQRVIDLGTLPQAAEQLFESAGPNEWLVREVPATRAVTRISAAAADAGTARLLRLAESDPLLVVTRETFLGEAPLTEARLTHPAARYEVTTVSM